MRTRNHKGNVFVGNLPTDFSDERLAEAFDPYGIVLSAAKFFMSATWHSKAGTHWPVFLPASAWNC